MSTTSTQHVQESHSSEGEDSGAGSLAERRALHNSVERTRREALNAKFTHLAQQLPSLSHIHRPSKSVIISHCLDMIVDLREAKAENEALRQEIHYLHSFIAGQRRPSPPKVQQRSNLVHGEGLNSLEPSKSPPSLQPGHVVSIRTPSPGNYSQHLMGNVASMPLATDARSTIPLDQGSMNVAVPVAWSNPMYGSMQQPMYAQVPYPDNAGDYRMARTSESSASTRISENYEPIDHNTSRIYQDGLNHNSGHESQMNSQYYRPDLYL